MTACNMNKWLNIKFIEYDFSDPEFRWMSCETALGPDALRCNFLSEEFIGMKNDLEAYVAGDAKAYSFESLESNLKLSLERGEEGFQCAVWLYEPPLLLCGAKFRVKERYLREFIHELWLFNEEMALLWTRGRGKR